MTRTMHLRPPADDTEWINPWCVVCGEWLEESDLFQPPFRCYNLYVDGEPADFPVCEACAALPRETLTPKLESWVADVIEPTERRQ